MHQDHEIKYDDRLHRVMRVEELDREGRPVRQSGRIHVVREQVREFEDLYAHVEPKIHRDDQTIDFSSNLLDRRPTSNHPTQSIDASERYGEVLILGPLLVFILYSLRFILLRRRIVSKHTPNGDDVLRSAECSTEDFMKLNKMAESGELIPRLLNDSEGMLRQIKLMVSSIAKETAVGIRVYETNVRKIEMMTHILQIILANIQRRKGSSFMLSNPGRQIYWIQLEMALANVCKEFIDAKTRLHMNFHAPYERAEKHLESVLESENIHDLAVALEICNLTGHNMERDIIRHTRDRLLLLQLDAKRAFERSLRAGEELDLEYAQRLLLQMLPCKLATSPSAKRALEFPVNDKVSGAAPMETSEIESSTSPSVEHVAGTPSRPEDQPGLIDPAIMTEIIRMSCESRREVRARLLDFDLRGLESERMMRAEARGLLAQWKAENAESKLCQGLDNLQRATNSNLLQVELKSAQERLTAQTAHRRTLISRVCYFALLLSFITYVSATSSGTIWTAPSSWFLGHVGCFCEIIIASSDTQKDAAILPSIDCASHESFEEVVSYEGSLILSSYITETGVGSLFSAVLPYYSTTSHATLSNFARTIQAISNLLGVTMRFATCGGILAIDCFSVIIGHLLFRTIIYYCSSIIPDIIKDSWIYLFWLFALTSTRKYTIAYMEDSKDFFWFSFGLLSVAALVPLWEPLIAPRVDPKDAEDEEREEKYPSNQLHSIVYLTCYPVICVAISYGLALD